ncbi:MAG: hypothetical protein JSR60_19065 [Proteobacteria bacterium]|nr:hypothetical protein [Pseudomonadota bacterium]
MVRGLLDPALCAYLWNHLHIAFASGTMKRDRVSALVVYGDPAFESLLEFVRPKLEAATGRTLLPTYSYARMHRRGDTLKIHHDRPASEIVATINLGQEPDKPWPFTVGGRNGPVRAELGPGDSMIYLGHELKHWRAPFEGHKLVQCILSYVDRDGPHAAEKYDGRGGLMRPPVRPDVEGQA